MHDDNVFGSLSTQLCRDTESGKMYTGLCIFLISFTTGVMIIFHLNRFYKAKDLYLFKFVGLNIRFFSTKCIFPFSILQPHLQSSLQVRAHFIFSSFHICCQRVNIERPVYRGEGIQKTPENPDSYCCF